MNEKCMAELDNVIRCSLFAAWTTRMFGTDPHDAPVIAEAYKSLAYAVRDAADVIAESLPRERPADWDLTPGGDTA